MTGTYLITNHYHYLFIKITQMTTFAATVFY